MEILEVDSQTVRIESPSGTNYRINIGGPVIEIEIHGVRPFRIGDLAISNGNALGIALHRPGIITELAVRGNDTGYVERRLRELQEQSAVPVDFESWMTHLFRVHATSDIIGVWFVGRSCVSWMKLGEITIPEAGSMLTFLIPEANGH